jgi:hypothetical protein
MVLRARFDGKVFIPEGPVALAADRLVDLDIREVESPPKGSGEAILRMLRELPPLEPGDADALMAAINGAEIPPEQGGAFDEDEPLSGSK